MLLQLLVEHSLELENKTMYAWALDFQCGSFTFDDPGTLHDLQKRFHRGEPELFRPIENLKFVQEGGEQFNLKGKVVSLRLEDYFALCQPGKSTLRTRECKIARNLSMAI